MSDEHDDRLTFTEDGYAVTQYKTTCPQCGRTLNVTRDREQDVYLIECPCGVSARAKRCANKSRQNCDDNVQ